MNTKESKVAIWVKIENYPPAEIDIEGSKSLSDLANAILTNPETAKDIAGRMTFHYTADGESISPRTTIEEVIREMTLKSIEELIVKPLVMSPPESVPVAALDETKLAAKLGDIIRAEFEARDNKRSVCSISKVNPEIWTEVAKSLNLEEGIIRVNEPDAAETFPSYKWIADDNLQQRESYMKYLNDYVAPVFPPEVQLLDVSSMKSLFNVDDARLPYHFKGGTDVLVVDKDAVKIPNLRCGIRMVIELKKEINEAYVFQTYTELILADLLAPKSHSVVGLLTNLNNHWLFSWIEEKKLVQLRLENRSNAVDFIKQILDWKEGYNIPLIDRPMKRMKVGDFVPLRDNGIGEAMEDLERYELLDEVEPETLMAKRLKVADKYMRLMPQFQSIPPIENYMSM